MKVCPTCGTQYPDDANFCPLDAGMLVIDERASAKAPVAPLAPEPKSGDRVIGGRFKLMDMIGGGLTGQVYKAEDQQSGATCAIKLVDESVFPSPVVMQRSERELKQLARLESKSIAKIIAHGKEGNALWIATEAVAESRSLHEIVFDDGPMDLERASKLVLRVGQALADAAKVGVIHRDLAPKNILVSSGDEVKIINFGVAVPATDKVGGVPEFVAPEMVEGKPVDQRANIYSLGTVFYYMLTGRPPYMGEPDEVHAQHLDGTPEPPSEHSEVPDVVDGVVLKALQRASAKRFMTLRQFLSAVEHLAQGHFEQIPAAVTQPLVRAGGKGKKRALSQTMLQFGGAARTQPADKAAEATPADGAEAQETATGTDSPPQAAAESAQSPESGTTPGETLPMGSAAAQDAAEPGAESTPPSGEPTADAARPAEAAEAKPAETPEAKPAEAAEAKPEETTEAEPAEAEPDATAAASPASEPGKTGAARDRFHETQWFKKGAIEEVAQAGAEDKQYSLASGQTQSLPAAGRKPGGKGGVSDAELISEMKGGRGKVIALVIVGILAIIALIAFAMSSSHDDKGGDTQPPASSTPER